MVEKYISTVHIEKLGHTIQEIRERALKNVVSKLDSGFEFDNDLARSREILQKLFEWFYFPDCSCETIVLKLIKDILKTESGKTVIKCYGNDKILKELKQICNHVEPKHYSLINSISEYVKKHEKEKEVVPPLESDIPLSYRSEEYYLPFATMKTAETTASTIEGLVEGSSTNEQQTGVKHNIEDFRSLRFESNKSVNDICSYMPHYTLCWYPLMNTDQHVLESVENSLINPIEPSALLHTFDFFSNVMLHDFPAEVFLQRPHILQELQKLISTCTSSRIKAAVLTALIKFTKLLNIRINYCSDPCMHNLKQFFLFSSHSNLSSPVEVALHSNRTSARSSSASEIEKLEVTNILKTKQIPIPLFCLNTIRCILDYLYTKSSNIKELPQKKKWRVCTTKALLLLNNLVDLFGLCVCKNIWDCRENTVIDDVIKILREIFIKFGDTIEYIRLETISNDFEMNTRFIHISLLNNCLKFLSLTVPEEKINIILPRNLKNVITYSLLDSSISRLYPGIHENLLKLIKEFIGRYENDAFSKYQDIKAVCKSMSAAIKFLKNYKSLPFHDSILLVKASLKSLDYHKKYTLIKIFVELCANKLSVYRDNINIRENITGIVLDLLSHPDVKIRKEMYGLCAKRVIAAIGPKLNNNKTGAPGSQILFLLESPILNEITLYGLSSYDAEIQKLSEDILVPILKCKMLVSNEIWNCVIEALILAFPALLCYVDKVSMVGRTVMSFLDPDKAEEMNLTKLEIFKSNSCLLFIDDAVIREEAVSRLCWLLASQGDNKDLLPRINSLFDKSLSVCCQIKHFYDVNREYNVQHYYQPSSLQQLLELLNSSNVEPVIRRSALTQICVMMEDSMMHNTFIEKNGFEIIIDIMKSALDESDYRDYPDSIIPAVSILKNICLYSASFRQQLCTNLDLYYLLLRGLFLFCTEERMKHEGSTLLFLLLYNHFIKGSPSKCDFGLPEVVEKLNVPFICHINIRKDQDENKLTDMLLQDKCCLQSLRIHWNSQWFQGFNELLKCNEICYRSTDDFNNVLRLSNADLFEIQSSSLEFCMNNCLKVLQNATSHQDVIDSLVKLIGYVNLYQTMKYNFIFESDILTLAWKETFSRFLNTIPASDEDNELLQYILEFLAIIIPLYKEKGIDCWISDFLKNDTNSLLTLLSSDNNQDNETKAVNKELLTLITACVCSEHHYLDFYGLNMSNSLLWSHVIAVIASNLEFNDTQHFYNLAYLDSLLSCLVHLTASLGWTKAKHEFNSKNLLVQLVTGLCEMIGAFHCGKGASAANSVMGLSITRHAVLILNHLLVEMQQCNIKDWESFFIEEESGIEDIFYNLTSLWDSRDVILRAGTFQLFAGLATSHRCAVEIIRCYKHKRELDVREVMLNILLDHEESSIVRENVANMLINLVSHTTITTRDEFTLDIIPTTASQVTNTISEVLNLLNNVNFYKELEVCINCLYIENKFFINEDEIIKLLEEQNSTRNEKCIYTFTKRTAITKQSQCSGSTNDNGIFIITTPGLIKSLSIFLYNLIGLAPVEITTQLQNHGIIKLLLRSLFIPDIEIKSTRDLSLYCDILEMNRAICGFLGRAVSYSELCFNTILNTRDCLNILISLLNANSFNSEFSQLIYLRNKLWTEIFTLLSALLNYEDIKNQNVRDRNVLEIISATLSETGNDFFLQTLCESISTYNSIDLQNSALNSLTSLLKAEIAIKENTTVKIKSRSIQDLLDGTYTPRTSISSQDNKENLEKFSPNNNHKISPKNISSSERTPQQFYLGSLNNITKNTTFKQFENGLRESNFVIAGAELCRILLYILNVASIRSSTNNKRKSLILNSLTNILCISQEAKKYALNNGLLDVIIKQIREIHIKLTLESVESLRRVSDKKRIVPFLQEIAVLIRLLMNFMVADVSVKNSASTAGLSDLIHKVWIWILHQNNLLVDTLKMLCTYTTNCQAACQSLTLTSPVAGSGPRKVPSNVSLLHAIITLISKEMDQISRTHDLSVLKLSFQLLQNSCLSAESRIILSKSNLFQSLTRLHPAITKKQKPWEMVELIWLEFLQIFSRHSEGQFSIAKIMDVLDLIIILTNSNKMSNASAALIVLRNISFYSSNRPRLLTCGDFLNMLGNKLISGNISDKNVVVTIIWALAANNQKAKLMLKCAGLETKLQETLKTLHLSTEYKIDPKELDRMHYVLNILRDSDK